MIIAKKSEPSLDDFKLLMMSTDHFLNQDAAKRQDYYSQRNGIELEKDVFNALQHCAHHTPFENSISLVSGASFPDIIAHNFYGVEVKSTIKNHWKSIGSSILESTRNKNVERIFLTFGKLGDSVAFKSRPYEECLSGISVTHYPRYQIDMELQAGNTIFDKIGIPYDVLRKMENPVLPVSKYYKNMLKAGESLWWVSNENLEESASPPVLRLWTTLTSTEKNYYTVTGYALFPEILCQSNSIKYQRYALWLATNCSIINTNIRDQFSAGGKVQIETIHGTFKDIPAAFGKIQKNRWLIEKTIAETSETILLEFWKTSEISKDRLIQWFHYVATNASGHNNHLYNTVYKMLCGIFERPIL